MYTVVSSIGVVDGYHHQNNIMEQKKTEKTVDNIYQPH